MANSEKYPVDTDKLLHIVGGSTIVDILQQAEAKWPDILPEELNIEPAHVQVSSFGYDLYDRSDYTNVLIVSAADEYFARTTTPVAQTA